MHRPAALLMLAILPWLLTACQSFRSGAAEAPPEPFQLILHLDKQTYRPGEAVQAVVQLVHPDGPRAEVRALNADSVRFYFGRAGSPERMERQAVASKKEPLGAMDALDAQTPLHRRFLLTRLTEFGGDFVVQAHYSSGGVQSKGQPPKVYSGVVAVSVRGARLFERDPQGFLKKQEAIDLARAAAGSGARKAEALCIEDEMGFYKWWVNVHLAPADRVVSFFVDPYLGRVWHQADKPFDPKLAQDPRSQRPANLPALPTHQDHAMPAP